VRTTWFADSSPTGTSGSAGLGIRTISSSSWASAAASSASSFSIWAPASVDAWRSAATSGPFGAAPARIASPICLEAVLRSALRRSESTEQVAALALESQGGIDDRRVLALVDRSLPNPIRLLAQPGQPDAHELLLLVVPGRSPASPAGEV
jgi:hypothetical protein